MTGRRLRRNPLAILSASYLAVVIGLAIVWPLASSYDTAERAGAPLETPSGAHWLGTDSLGRDELTRLLAGGRVSLLISVSVVAVAVAIAVPLGIVSGYRGGRIDFLLMRVSDAAVSFPSLILMMAVAGVLGPSPGNTVIALLVVMLPGLLRVVRGQALAVTAEPFVEASQSIGTGGARIMLKRVLPNVASPVIVQSTVLLGAALMAEAGLSYLGLGPRPPTPSWGAMLREGYDTALFTDPRLVILPGVAIALTVLSFNTLGDALRDGLGAAASGPRGRGQRRGLTTVRIDGPRSVHGPQADDAVLRISDLAVTVDVASGPVEVVHGIDLTVGTGEVLALVGESGCGKSVTAMAVSRLLPSPPMQITRGQITLGGVDVLGLSLGDLRRVRGRDIGVIFQDPMTSLNPAYSIEFHLIEAIRNHRPIARRAARLEAVRLLQEVGIPGAERRLGAYPHELSGGMRQRVMIAMALANRPKLLVADEPTTALDVTIQAQILDLLRRLQADHGMAMLFVTHDLGVVADIAHRVAVMYAGEIVEQADVVDLFDRPVHPYTRGLLQATPSNRDRDRRRLPTIPGTVPLVGERVDGCAFAARCPDVADPCRSGSVALVPLGPTTIGRCLRATPQLRSTPSAGAPAEAV